MDFRPDFQKELT